MGTDRYYDPACQLERTALASNRLLLALSANGALLVRASGHVGAWAAVAGIAILAAGGVLWLTTGRVYRRLRGGPADAGLSGRVAAAGIVVLVAGVGVMDLLAIAMYRV